MPTGAEHLVIAAAALVSHSSDNASTPADLAPPYPGAPRPARSRPLSAARPSSAADSRGAPSDRGLGPRACRRRLLRCRQALSTSTPPSPPTPCAARRLLRCRQALSTFLAYRWRTKTS